MKKKAARPGRRKPVAAPIVQTLHFNRNDIVLNSTPFGIRIAMKDFQVDGRPGAPALPHRIVRLALPKGHCFKRLKMTAGSVVLLNHTPEPVACIQKPSIGPAPELPASRYKRPMTMPDAGQYREAFEGGGKICRFAGEMMMGLIPCALIELRPVRFTKEGLLELVTSVTVTVLSEPSAAVAAQEQENTRRFSARKIVRQHVVAEDLVINKDLARKELRRSVARLEKVASRESAARKAAGRASAGPAPAFCDYLIVTDNNTWNAETIQPTGSIGDMASKFQQLANWKKARGLRTHVALVKNIVDGCYGDFKTGARDLQEVIRNFLKWFCGPRGVDFLLLGGDVGIIPARRAAGVAWGQIWPGSLTEKNVSAWKNTYLGMRVEPGDFGDPSHILTNYNTGKIIPFDGAGTSDATTPGWYHTTDDTFATRTADQTEWIRVNGPAAKVNAPMAWYTDLNLIPTDLYYGSLYGSGYSVAGKHDWDHLNNGLYGQHNAANNFDNVDYQPDVSVGRAPVDTPAQAETFVNKVLEYEKWGAAPRPEADFDRFRSMLFAAATWGKFIRIPHDDTSSVPPPNNTYRTSGEYALLHCDTLPPDAGDQLICFFDDQYYRRLNFRLDAKHNNPGWYYAKSANDPSPSFTEYNFFFFSLKVPVPTPWIVVRDGNPDVLHPMYYALDFSTLDSSITEQESLREKMGQAFPGLTNIERLYTDEADMNPAEVAETWLRHLTPDNLEQALNRGPHFVSMTGHGNSDWCAYLCTALVNKLTNGPETFILYADSCLTGQFDVNDAVAEASLKHPGGGAVAYVGNSRFSWIGTGALYRELFFLRLQTNRHIGEMNDSRYELLQGTTGWARESRIWYCYVPHLFGDPEMPVYRNVAEAKNYYIGNHNTDELHDCRCQWVERMTPNHKVHFEKLQDGLSAGYDGCGFCLRKHHTK